MWASGKVLMEVMVAFTDGSGFTRVGQREDVRKGERGNKRCSLFGG